MMSSGTRRRSGHVGNPHSASLALTEVGVLVYVTLVVQILLPPRPDMARRVGIPARILREMQADGVLPPGVMVVGPLDTPRIVDPTAAMEAWCHMKAAAS